MIIRNVFILEVLKKPVTHLITLSFPEEDGISEHFLDGLEREHFRKGSYALCRGSFQGDFSGDSKRGKKGLVNCIFKYNGQIQGPFGNFNKYGEVEEYVFSSNSSAFFGNLSEASESDRKYRSKSHSLHVGTFEANDNLRSIIRCALYQSRVRTEDCSLKFKNYCGLSGFNCLKMYVEETCLFRKNIVNFLAGVFFDNAMENGSVPALRV